MTRDEAQATISNFLNNDDDPLCLQPFVDKIYDDFENRTCENCIHYNNNGLWCTKFDLEVRDFFSCRVEWVQK